MRTTTAEHLLSYFDRVNDYLESRLPTEDSEQLHSAWEILLGEKLDTELPSTRAAYIVMRKRMAAVLEGLREPTPAELKQLDELERTVKELSRAAVWKTMKEFVVALIPRGHGYGPAPMIEKSDFPNVIAAVEEVESEHPEWKREAIYAEVGKKFGTSGRTIQDAYLEAKKHQSPKAR